MRLFPWKKKVVDYGHFARTLRLLGEKCGLESKKGRLVASPAFLEAVAGHYDCTPTQAYQLWIAVFSYLDRLAERYAPYADIAAIYGVDPFGLDDQQRAGMGACIPRIKAQRQLDAGNFDPTDYAYVYSLVLTATGDESQAIKARGRAMEALVDAKTR